MKRVNLSMYASEHRNGLVSVLKCVKMFKNVLMTQCILFCNEDKKVMTSILTQNRIIVYEIKFCLVN